MLLCSIRPNLIKTQPSRETTNDMIKQINDARSLYLDGYITYDDYVAIHDRLIRLVYGK